MKKFLKQNALSLISAFLLFAVLGAVAIALQSGIFTTAPDDSPDAAATLTRFFQDLSAGKYAEAEAMLHLPKTGDGSWEWLAIFGEPTTDRVQLLAQYCAAVPTCLPARIVSERAVSETEYVFTVQFLRPDGSIFVLGPCCGATEEEMPPQDSFIFHVHKFDGSFRVATPPVYVP